MNQADCLQVQIAQIELARTGRAVLPLDPTQLAALLAGAEPLPVPLEAGNRAKIALHLENCPSCRSFWTEQVEMDDLFQASAFELPAEADELELQRLKDRIIGDLAQDRGLQPDSPAANPSPGAKIKHHVFIGREVHVSRNYRKYWVLAAAVLVVTVGLVYLSFYYPPVSEDHVQGAIGKRDVYRETNMTENDVTASTGPVHAFDGLLQYMKSPEYKKLRDDPNFKKLAGNQADFSGLVSNPLFEIVLQNQMQAGTNLSQFATALGPLSTFAAAHESAFFGLFSSPEFQNAIQNCGSHASLMANKPLSVLVESHPSYGVIINSQQFANAINNTAVLGVLQQNAGLLPSFANLLTNGAFNVFMTNSGVASALNSNPAFGSMVANPSFALANQLGALQNNSAFNALANSNQFFGLLNDPNFQALANNAQMQSLMNSAAVHQMVSSKPLDSAGLESLVHESQYQSLAGNTNFQSLVSNGTFLAVLSHPSFPVLQTEFNLGSLVLNQQVFSNVHNLGELNGMINQASSIHSTMFGSF